MVLLTLALLDVSHAQALTDEVDVASYPNGWVFTAQFGEPPLFGDFDADGRADVLRPSAATSFYLPSAGDGTFTGRAVTYDIFDLGTDRTVWRPLAGDFTGDDSDDVFWAGVSRLRLHESTPSNFSWYDQANPAGWRFDGSFDVTPLVGDFDGDGIDDVVRPASTNAFLFTANGSGGFDGQSGNYAPARTYNIGATGYRTGVGDFDGDGIDELLMVTGSTLDVVNLDGATFTISPAYPIPNGWTFTSTFDTPLSIGDFNGDGRDDLARFAATQIYLFLSTGTGFTASVWVVPNSVTFATTDARLVGDFNGDGRIDLARRKGDETHLFLFDTADSTWDVVTLPALAMPTADAAYIGVGDVDANGTDDILYAGTHQLGVQRFFAAVVGDLEVTQGSGRALETATVTAQLTADGEPVAGITVRARVENASGVVLPELVGVTDLLGNVTFTWPLDASVPRGEYTVYLASEDDPDLNAATAQFFLVVTGAARPLEIPSLLPATYGDSGFILPLRGPGGGSATITTSGDCTNQGDTIITTGAGSCTITADVPADEVYDAGSASAFLAIQPAPLVIIASDEVWMWGDPEISPDVQTLGLVGADTLADLDGALVLTTPPSPVGAGQHPVTPAGLTSDDYDIQFVAGTVTVMPAPLFVAADCPVSVYGSGPVTATLTYDGFVNGDTVAALEGVPTLSHEAGDEPDAGVYPITISDGTAPNYTLYAVDGAVTVVPAPLLVGVADAVMVAGGTVPAPVITYLGFRYDDDASLFVPAPTVTVSAPVDPPPGQYQRGVIGADHPNYQTLTTEGQLLVLDPEATVLEPAPTPDEADGCSSVPHAPTGALLLLAALGLKRRRAD